LDIIRELIITEFIIMLYIQTITGMPFCPRLWSLGLIGNCRNVINRHSSQPLRLVLLCHNTKEKYYIIISVDCNFN